MSSVLCGLWFIKASYFLDSPDKNLKLSSTQSDAVSVIKMFKIESAGEKKYIKQVLSKNYIFYD